MSVGREKVGSDRGESRGKGRGVGRERELRYAISITEVDVVSEGWGVEGRGEGGWRGHERRVVL